MSATHLNDGIVGQLADGVFVHRLYQESHVRFRMFAKYEGDQHVANVVEYRFISGTGIADFTVKCEVFGTTALEHAKAFAVFKAWVSEYLLIGALPQ